MKTWTMAEIERAAILSTWQRCEYSIARAAKTLKMGKTTFYRKLRQYGVPSRYTHKVLCDDAARQMEEIRVWLAGAA